MVRFCSFACALLLVLVCGCGEYQVADSDQSGGKPKPADVEPTLQALQDLADVTGRFADALEKIDGEESAKASVSQLNSLLGEIEQCGGKMLQVADSGALPEDERFKTASDEFNRSNARLQEQVRRLGELPSVRETLLPVKTRYAQISLDLASKGEAKVASLVEAENRTSQDSKVTVKIINVRDSTAGERMMQIATGLQRSCGAESFSARAQNDVATVSIWPVRDFDQLVAYAKKAHKVTSVDKAARLITIDSDGTL